MSSLRDLAELIGRTFCAMIDQCVAQAAHPEAPAAAVRNLQAMEQKNGGGLAAC
ncbi:hypothetical protein [Dysosmobacter welbionis]|uniref:hypothetical protein n=1 Tax=Dysosmobacter welbionis TaxID=2093857 RepID=UPI002354C583|nr:hypothetical protein [Dysosmobacter welbionis]